MPYIVKSTFDPKGTKEWIINWYKGRIPQIASNIKNSDYNINQLNNQFNNLLSFTWYKSPKLLPKYVKNQLTKHNFDNDWVNGMTIPKYKLLYFNNPILPGNSIQIHEGTHSQIPLIQASLIPENVSLKNGVVYDDYYDDPEEVYSRLMEFRYANNLDPSKKYTIEQIRKMKDYGDGGSSWPEGKRPLDLLDRYDDKSLLWLINELAYNNNGTSEYNYYAKKGGILKYQKGKYIKAGELAKQHLTKSKNPDWKSFDTGYNLMIRKGLNHGSSIAIMGNVMQESAGYHNAKQIGGSGYGLVQWTGTTPPKGGLIPQWTALYESAAKPANVYNKKTKTSDNYWKKVNGVKGTDVQKRFTSKDTSTKEKTRIYAQSYLRPGKPELDKRILYSAQLDSVYNPKIKNKLVKVRKSGGWIPGVIDSNPNLDNMKGNYKDKKVYKSKK